jgi:hypothetical protein
LRGEHDARAETRPVLRHVDQMHLDLTAVIVQMHDDLGVQFEA